MSEKVDEKTGEVTVVQARPVMMEKYDPNDPIQLYMNPAMFDQLQRFGSMLASSQLVPTHLQNQPSNCALVAAQAFRWKMDPFNVAQATYVVSGKLGYEGKLIAAVINANSKLETTLNYEYKGEGDGRTVRVFGTLKGEDKPRDVTGSLKKWKTKNSQWIDNVDQMLSYRGAREWARRHMPEAVLGVQSIDEVQDIAEQEAQKVLPEVLEGILSSSEVKATDDPPERGAKVVEVTAEVVETKKQKKSEKVKVPKQTVNPRTYEVGEEYKGKIVEEIDDAGQIVILGNPKKKEALSEEDEELDGLFK